MERQAGKAIGAVRANQAVITAQETAKVEIVEDVGKAGLLAVANVSALEGLLAARTPHAAGRLQHVADTAALGIGEVVLNATRRVR